MSHRSGPVDGSHLRWRALASYVLSQCTSREVAPLAVGLVLVVLGLIATASSAWR